MTDLNNLLSKSLTAFDANRDRSKQVEVGPSGLGGCRRQIYYHLTEQPTTNPETESLAAILGTFIHAGISEAIVREDPFGDNFIIEEEVSHGGLKGHVDLFIKDSGMVVDWKTTKKKSLRYFPSEQQRWQVQTYGWLLANNGHQVNQVALVAIPRDGDMADIRVHVENYDEAIALEALNWLDEVKKLAETRTPPPAEKWAGFCANYCKYYDASGAIGCQGTTK
jgi:CRISPR/Cas system-associated exonuclease Cas4 (RecB family)